jgi:hypothetical protein
MYPDPGGPKTFGSGFGSGFAKLSKNDTYPDQQHWDWHQKTNPRFLGVFLTNFSLIEARGLVVDFYVAMKSMVSYSSNLGKGYFFNLCCDKVTLVVMRNQSSG